MKSLISVIIPTYNGTARIARTLESVINQDYENLEIILVDDVSSDNTVKISQDILERSGRQFQIIMRTVNGRQSAARNTGLNAAHGKYIMFFDHDDFAEKNFVSSLYDESEKKNADIVFCGCRHYYERENRFKDEPVTLTKKYSQPEDYLKAWAARKIRFWSMWNFIYNKSFLDENNLRFTERCYFGEDTEFVLKALSVSSCTSFVNADLYIHTHYDEQQTQADKLIRHNQNLYRQARLSRWRTGRYIAKHVHDNKVKNYARSFYMADAILKEFTMFASFGDRENYERLLKTTSHKKFRELMLSTYKILNHEPELFFKSLMLLYTPRFYYWLRHKKS